MLGNLGCQITYLNMNQVLSQLSQRLGAFGKIAAVCAVLILIALTLLNVDKMKNESVKIWEREPSMGEKGVIVVPGTYLPTQTIDCADVLKSVYHPGVIINVSPDDHTKVYGEPIEFGYDQINVAPTGWQLSSSLEGAGTQMMEVPLSWHWENNDIVEGKRKDYGHQQVTLVFNLGKRSVMTEGGMNQGAISIGKTEKMVQLIKSDLEKLQTNLADVEKKLTQELNGFEAENHQHDQWDADLFTQKKEAALKEVKSLVAKENVRLEEEIKKIVLAIQSKIDEASGQLIAHASYNYYKGFRDRTDLGWSDLRVEIDSFDQVEMVYNVSADLPFELSFSMPEVAEFSSHAGLTQEADFSLTSEAQLTGTPIFSTTHTPSTRVSAATVTAFTAKVDVSRKQGYWKMKTGKSFDFTTDNGIVNIDLEATERQ